MARLPAGNSARRFRMFGFVVLYPPAIDWGLYPDRQGVIVLACFHDASDLFIGSGPADHG